MEEKDGERRDGEGGEVMEKKEGKGEEEEVERKREDKQERERERERERGERNRWRRMMGRGGMEREGRSWRRKRGKA